MADENDQQEKTEEPTQHRIDEARKKGEVASSRELTSVLILSSSLLALTLSMLYAYEVLADLMTWIYGLSSDFAFNEVIKKELLSRVVLAGLKCTAPVFITVFCVGVLANILQTGFLFAPEVLNFRPERINPVAGFKRLFSMRSLVETAKAVFKFLIIVFIVYGFIKTDLSSYSGFLHTDLNSSFAYGEIILIKLAFAILLGLFIVSLGDFLYQRFAYKKKLMMSREELKREQREQEGRPEVKQRMRSIQREMTRRRMMQAVETADVIVTNPTHLSVALKYDRETMYSPEVVAKGADFMAFRIREIAQKHDVPMVENVPLARALYKTVKVGHPVPRSLYKVVAEVLAFVYRLKNKQQLTGESRI